MTDAMSKKEKLARGSAVIKVMKVNPRPGHYLKGYVDPRKLPKTVQVGAPKGVLAEMPWLDVKRAEFVFAPASAKVKIQVPKLGGHDDLCDVLKVDKRRPSEIGFGPDDKQVSWYGYRTWANDVNPLREGNLAEHFNVMLGLLISMTKDAENTNFADVEAYPCVQFLKTIKNEDGQIPFNTAQFIGYIEYVCQKVIDEG